MLNWQPYDHHDWAKCKQPRFRPPEKNKIEQLVAKILRVRGGETRDCWGTVYPPGRNALVIKIHPDARHGHERAGIHLGLKLYNLKDGKVMWPSVFRFHKEQRQILPGLPHAQVQEVMDWGTIPDADGRERGYLIQHWVKGEVLDQKIKAGLGAAEVLQILDGLFLKLIIPLWSQGSCWWDVRESNYVVTPAGRLMMIDSDTLGAYADEILNRPKVYAKRNHGSLTAMKRYASLIVKLACGQAGQGTKKETERRVRQIIAIHLQPAFCAPYPLAPGWNQTATQAYLKFRDGYETWLRPVTRQASTHTAPPK